MRRIGWLTMGLALAFAPALASAADVQDMGVGPAYETLGRLPVLHQGRQKPLDTLARQILKQISGVETIKLLDAAGKPAARWGHIGALFDISVRPEFWDEQDIIRVDYLPLKRLILAEPVKARLKAVADKASTSEADKAKLRALAEAPAITAEQLTDLVQSTRLAKDDRVELATLATRLSGEHRWISPRDLEEAQVAVEGRTVPFGMWLADIAGRLEGGEMGQRPALPEIEKKAYEAGVALRYYQALRGDRIGAGEPLDLVMPRPHNEAYLKYSADVKDKYMKLVGETQSEAAVQRQMTPLENNVLRVLAKYLEDVPDSDRKQPGTDKAFDARFTAWLKEKSSWVPLKVLVESEPQELERAGFPYSPLTAFRSAYRALVDAENAAPGRVAESKTAAFVGAARDLGEAVGDYPPPVALARETHFNAFAPFYKAAWGYGLGLVLLLLSLGIVAEGPSAVGRLGRSLYWSGMIALLAGIGLEIYGFYYRVRISGWAPVTNMYETVIWVALVTAVLGLAMELIYRRTYAALAASGVALLATVLAYKVPLLDANIKSLTPVLRSNYWLAIHVLTIVSSYAAFALAMGLGLIATGYYLTATYRRSVGYGELARPLVPGLPLLGLGALGVYASYQGWGPAWIAGTLTPWLEPSHLAYYASSVVAGLGGILTIMAVGGMVGESISRALFREEASLDGAALAGAGPAPATAPMAAASVGGSGGTVATLSRPTVAEIRAREAVARPKLDARALAMQATAAKIKPLSNFIYRAMQVGVLLCAAGTILGGLWADVSWGRFWGWDPKEVWALITLLVYLVPLHGRFAGWVNTFVLVVASVACFLSVVMAWYGVNFVLGVGLHSYGFTEGGGQGVVSAACAGALAFVAAAAWRRSLGQRPGATVA